MCFKKMSCALVAFCFACSGGSAFSAVVLEDHFTDPAGPMVSLVDTLQIPGTATWFLSSAGNANYDGTSTLEIDQWIGSGGIPWQPNFETRGVGGTVTMSPPNEYAFVMIFNSPPTGGMSIGLTSQNVGFGGSSQRLFRVVGGTGQIWITKQGTWDPPSNGTDLGGTFVPGVLQGLMMRITDAASDNVRFYYQNGGITDPSSAAWTELTGGPGGQPQDDGV